MLGEREHQTNPSPLGPTQKSGKEHIRKGYQLPLGFAQKSDKEHIRKGYQLPLESVRSFYASDSSSEPFSDYWSSYYCLFLLLLCKRFGCYLE